MQYTIQNLSVRFPEIPLEAVRNVSFRLKEKRIFALVGETGSGKTMIARSILGMLPNGAIATGKVLRDGQNLLLLGKMERRKQRWQRISMVQQNAAAALNPLLSLKRHLQLASPHCLSLEDMTALLGRVNLEAETAFLNRKPFELSGGMKQRFLLALSLLKSPELIILDEPTRGLDEDLRTELGKEISRIRTSADAAVLLITHDLPFAKEISQDMAVLHEGQIVESGETKKLFAQPFHAYFRSLIGALPENGFQLPQREAGKNNVYAQMCKVAEGHYVRCLPC